MKAINRQQTAEKQNMTNYWLNPDGSTYWGLPLAYRGKMGKAKRISCAFYRLDLPESIKAAAYRWKNFWQ